MHPQQYPAVPSAPPPYNSDMTTDQHSLYQSMPNYHTTSEERMRDFQQLVGRYESELL